MIELVILRGAAGAGKSTYAQNHFVSKGYVKCEADDFFIIDGQYKFDRSKLGQAHSHCQLEVYKNLAEGRNVVVANTNITQKEVNTYIHIAKGVNVPYRIIRLTKNFGNVHNVPGEIVESMKQRLVPIPGEEVITDY